MGYQLLPRTGIGPIRLGMSRDEVRAILVDPPEELPRPEGVPMDCFVGARLQADLPSEALQVAVSAGSARKDPDTPVEAIAVFAPGCSGGSDGDEGMGLGWPPYQACANPKTSRAGRTSPRWTHPAMTQAVKT